MERAAITGATGAIGTALIGTLLENDISVLVITRRDSKRNNRIPKDSRVKVLCADLAELATLDISGEEKCDAFFHLAWAGASGSGRNDMPLQESNIRYALDAVLLAKKLGCDVFLGAGSQAEYGLSNDNLTPETSTKPFTGYGFAKLCAGQMTRALAQQHGMRHIWTRILSVYGPNDGENSMISMLIKKLRSGQTVRMTEGTQIWDYLYSYDAAQALYLLAERGKDGKTYVLGSGRGMPLKDYAEIVKGEISPESTIEYGAIPFSENQVMHLCADINEIKKDTGWEPKISFKDGIKETIAKLLETE